MSTAMICPVVRPEPDILCAPSTDPAGFIYPTYRAAGTEASRDKHSLKSSHQGVAYVSSSVGGSVSTLSFQDTTPSNYWRPPMRRAGGIRDRVRASQGLAAEIYSGVWRASTEAPSGPSEGGLSS